MANEAREPLDYLRCLLILGRTSNLPTVWSNCLAGWLLGGGATWGNLGFLFVGATLIYIGGMFLNDAFDADFDRQHRSERPIPSGAISREEVWLWGLAWLGLGMLCLLVLGRATAGWVALLLFLIIAYDAIHKWFPASPVLMAGCRTTLLLLAASTGAMGVTGTAIWCSIALGCYVVGLSFIARKESTGMVLQKWPCLLLLIPCGLAIVMNGSSHVIPAALLIALVLAWIARCLQWSWFQNPPRIGATVGGLLAGIPLVDALALGGEFWWVFGLLFGAAHLFQRFIPAT